MFNISGVELAVIAIAALLLLGPQRLPEVARGLGKFLREFRRQTDDVRTMVEREFYQMDQEIQKVVEPVTDSVHEAMADKPANAASGEIAAGEIAAVESGPPTALLPPSGLPEAAPPSSDPSGVTGEMYDAQYHAAEANGLLPPSAEAHPEPAPAQDNTGESTEPNLPDHRTPEPQNAGEQEPTARAK